MNHEKEISLAMDKCKDNILKLKKSHIEIAEEIIKKNPEIVYCDMFVISTIKRSLDILDTFNYATKTYNLSTQIPLLRLQIDNCILVQVAIMQKNKGLNISQKIWKNNFDIRNFKDEVVGNLSESKVTKIIGKKYPSFAELYKFCNKFVHFTSKANTSLINKVDKKKISIAVKVGNEDRVSDVITNSNDMLNVTKVLFAIINEYLGLTKSN